jgi:hypothetical protein
MSYLFYLLQEFKDDLAVHPTHLAILQGNLYGQVPIQPVPKNVILYGTGDQEVREAAIIIRYSASYRTRRSCVASRALELECLNQLQEI